MFEYFISVGSKHSAFDDDLSASFHLENLIVVVSNKRDDELDKMLTLASEENTSLNSEKSFVNACRELSSECTIHVLTLHISNASDLHYFKSSSLTL